MSYWFLDFGFPHVQVVNTRALYTQSHTHTHVRPHTHPLTDLHTSISMRLRHQSTTLMKLWRRRRCPSSSLWAIDHQASRRGGRQVFAGSIATIGGFQLETRICTALVMISYRTHGRRRQTKAPTRQSHMPHVYRRHLLLEHTAWSRVEKWFSS